ncbi:MAG: hypothetical protein A07HB70_01680 [uncultured archaeon A07HB70]|nr:MAG: hypothetical protein A07HB70_01680 [uncultured archaeon A07HB70]
MSSVSLVRVGTLVGVLGLALAALWAVAFGALAGCTDVACPDQTPVYSVARVTLLPSVRSVSDGCNACVVASPVVYGSIAALAGVVVAGVGRLRRRTGGI